MSSVPVKKEKKKKKKLGESVIFYLIRQRKVTDSSQSTVLSAALAQPKPARATLNASPSRLDLLLGA